MSLESLLPLPHLLNPKANVILSTVRVVRMLEKCPPARSHQKNLQPSLYNCPAGVEGPAQNCLDTTFWEGTKL